MQPGRDVILIPTYNERDTIGEIVPRILDAAPHCHIVVIDDNSPDGTARVVAELSKDHPQLSLINRAEKRGLGAAYKDTLMSLSRDETVRSFITMDADGSHDPSYLPTLLEKIEGHDLVIGSRYAVGGSVRNWAIWRLGLSFFGNLYARIVAGLPIRDLTSGFICVRRELVQKLDLDSISASGYAYQIEFKNACVKAGAKFCEIPIKFVDRREGQSKMSGSIVVEGLITPWRIRFSRR